MSRSHTGRARNPEVRRAILDATLALLRESGPGALTMEGVARRARVGKQTVYRWWPGKGALIVEALSDAADERVALPDTGSLRGDLESFLAASFLGAADPAVAPVLRGLMAEAQRDPDAHDSLRAFTARRRDDLRTLLDRAARRRELGPQPDVGLLTDIAYGVLWYRLLVGHAPLDGPAAGALSELLARAVAPERG